LNKIGKASKKVKPITFSEDLKLKNSNILKNCKTSIFTVFGHTMPLYSNFKVFLGLACICLAPCSFPEILCSSSWYRIPQLPQVLKQRQDERENEKFCVPQPLWGRFFFDFPAKKRMTSYAPNHSGFLAYEWGALYYGTQCRGRSRTSLIVSSIE
jgi:hypothetical protein